MSIGTPENSAGEYDPDRLQLLTPLGQNFRMYVTPSCRNHYETQSYEPFTASLVGSILRRSELFVDIGANCGFYSLLAASRHPGLEIIALEPVPETCTILRRNIALLDRSRIAVCQAGTSDSVGTRPFNVAASSNQCGFNNNPAVGTLRMIDVATTTIDALLESRASCALVIKIDVEGHELSVLHGMSETLRRFPRVKLIVNFAPKALQAANVQPGAILEWLRDSGFSSFVLDEQHHRFYRASPEDNNLQWTRRQSANLYCVRREHAHTVCFFAHSSDLAGSERMLLELVEDLVTDHDAVCTVVMPRVGPLSALFEQMGVATIIAPYLWWCSDQSVSLTPEEKAQIMRESGKAITGSIVPILRLFDPDVIWSQTMVIPWGAVTSAILGKPHVWYVTEFGERDHQLKFFSPLAQTVREILNGSDIVFVLSRAIAHELFGGAWDERVQILYCNIRLPSNRKDLGDSTEQFFRRRTSVKLGIFATVQPSKGQDDIVRAVAELTRHGHDVELLIAGAFHLDYREALDDFASKNGIADRVNFSGQLADPYPAMLCVDIVVVCSRNEALGRTGFEAMLLGKPVVFANTGGMSEYCVEGETSLGYRPGDIEALVERLEELISNPARRRDMGTRGRSRAATLFTKDEYSGKVNQTFFKLRAAGKSLARMPDSVAPHIPTPNAPPELFSSLKLGRNEICPCGSGQRFKHCHGRYR